MAVKDMLKFRYQLGQGLGAVGRGSPTLIECGLAFWTIPIGL